MQKQLRKIKQGPRHLAFRTKTTKIQRRRAIAAINKPRTAVPDQITSDTLENNAIFQSRQRSAPQSNRNDSSKHELVPECSATHGEKKGSTNSVIRNKQPERYLSRTLTSQPRFSTLKYLFLDVNVEEEATMGKKR